MSFLLPDNAYLDESVRQRWSYNDGFVQSDFVCLETSIPDHAHLVHKEKMWRFAPGYYRLSDRSRRFDLNVRAHTGVSRPGTHCRTRGKTVSGSRTHTRPQTTHR